MSCFSRSTRSIVGKDVNLYYPSNGFGLLTSVGFHPVFWFPVQILVGIVVVLIRVE